LSCHKSSLAAQRRNALSGIVSTSVVARQPPTPRQGSPDHL